MVWTHQQIKKRMVALLFALIFLAAYVLVVFPERAAALQLQQRSLSISTPVANATAQHVFSFTYTTMSDPIGSVKFEYCTSPLPAIACVAPDGLDVSAAVLSQQSGEVGFALTATQPNMMVIGRDPAASPSAASQYVFDGIINPDGTPPTFYVRISTYQSNDATGTEIDFGAVVNSITEGVDISAEVPPLLNFCVGLTIGADCSSADGNLIDLGTLRTSTVSSGTSQMMAATNAEFGLAIAAYGTTMTSGNNIIPALGNPTPSAPGNAQFGFNLRANADPGIGEEPSGAGIAVPTSSYNIPNRYTFNSGDIVATSTAATDVRKFTSSYIVNISPSQPPGVYTATLTYICSATF